MTPQSSASNEVDHSEVRLTGASSSRPPIAFSRRFRAAVYRRSRARSVRAESRSASPLTHGISIVPGEWRMWSS